MKKTDHTKKLAIDLVTVRRLETELTPEQLKIVQGAADARGGSARAIC
jgi:hypothetical protein